jgi:hypothetical protein
MRRMESRIAGTTRRAWSGKPPPIQPEGKLRSVNLESAAGRQPFRRGRAGIKPSSRTNLEDGSSFAARHCEDRLDSSAVETQNLRRAIVNRRSSRGDRSAETRRTGPMLGGTPIWMSEVQTNEGGVGTRRKTLTRSGRKVNHASSGMTAPTTLPGSRVNVVRVASKQLAAIGSSQSSEGDEREELMSNRRTCRRC